MAKKKAPEDDAALTKIIDEAAGKPTPQEVLEKVKRETPDILFKMELAKPLADHNPATVLDRLDEMCGVGGWDMDISECNEFYKVTITLRVPDKNGVTYPVSRSAVRAQVPDAVAEAACAGWGLGGRTKFSGHATPRSQVATIATPQAETPKPEAAPAASRVTQTPATPPPPKREETQEEAITRWVTKITDCVTPESLNTLLPQMKKEKGDFQVAIWNTVKRTAKEVGWEWSDKLKSFYKTPEIEEPPSESVPW